MSWISEFFSNTWNAIITAVVSVSISAIIAGVIASLVRKAYTARKIARNTPPAHQKDDNEENKNKILSLIDSILFDQEFDKKQRAILERLRDDVYNCLANGVNDKDIINNLTTIKKDVSDVERIEQKLIALQSEIAERNR
jgi:hypothetical protein